MDVSSLTFFLCSVQFYGKLISHLATIAEQLYRLTKKATHCKRADEGKTAFEQLKNVICSDQALVYFNPNKCLGLACDAFNVGIGAILFHRYLDGSYRLFANMFKTYTSSERNYSQIHKETLAIIFGLLKFHQYLYGRLIINHGWQCLALKEGHHFTQPTD